MKTFVTSLFAVVAVSVSLSNSAYAQYSPAQYYNQALPAGSLADLKARNSNNGGLQYCLSMQGKVVGNGQCTALVEMHLAVSRAIPGTFSDPKNYVWGAVPNGWAPGDVLQFEGCLFKWKVGNGTRTVIMEHHTAIFVSANDGVVTLIHQNGPNGGAVVMEKVDFKGQQRGTITAFRPVGDY